MSPERNQTLYQFSVRFFRKLYQFGVWKTLSIWRIPNGNSINLAYGKLYQFGVFLMGTLSIWRMENSINLAYS